MKSFILIPAILLSVTIIALSLRGCDGAGSTGALLLTFSLGFGARLTSFAAETGAGGGAKGSGSRGLLSLLGGNLACGCCCGVTSSV